MVNSSINFQNPSGSTGGIFYLRQTILLLVFGFSCLIVHAQATLKVKDAKINFGYVKRGTVVKNSFEITNTGNEPLTIKDVEIACSCTTVDYPKQPVMPGQTAVILVVFNTTTVYGRQDREVFLISNDPKGPTKLRYKGLVSN